MKHHHGAHHPHHHPPSRRFDLRKTNWIIIAAVLGVIIVVFYLLFIPKAHAPAKISYTTAMPIEMDTWILHTDPAGFSFKAPPSFQKSTEKRLVDKKNVDVYVFADSEGSKITVSPFAKLPHNQEATAGETLVGNIKARTYFTSATLTIDSFALIKYPEFSVQIESPDPQFFEAVLSNFQITTN